MDTTLEQLSKELLGFLRLMDDEADTVSGYCDHAGLIDYASYKGVGGRKYEESWNDRLAELLSNDETNVFREHRYPNSLNKCDLVLRSKATVWLEVKAAWKGWFSSVTGKLKNNPNSYKGYLFGDAHRTHSVAHDIEKLNRLDSEVADYVGALVIGFDIANKPITPDMEQLIKNMQLKEDGWQIHGAEIWPDRNHPDCRYNCWFIGKVVV